MTRRLRLRGDLRQLVAQAQAAGWPITTTSSGHLRIHTPTGPVIAARTSASRRALANTRAQLRRAGLDTGRNTP